MDLEQERREPISQEDRAGYARERKRERDMFFYYQHHTEASLEKLGKERVMKPGEDPVLFARFVEIEEENMEEILENREEYRNQRTVPEAIGCFMADFPHWYTPMGMRAEKARRTRERKKEEKELELARKRAADKLAGIETEEPEVVAKPARKKRVSVKKDGEEPKRKRAPKRKIEQEPVEDLADPAEPLVEKPKKKRAPRKKKVDQEKMEIVGASQEQEQVEQDQALDAASPSADTENAVKKVRAPRKKAADGTPARKRQPKKAVQEESELPMEAVKPKQKRSVKRSAAPGDEPKAKRSKKSDGFKYI